MTKNPEPGRPLADPILPAGNPSRADAIPLRVVQTELAALEADVRNLFNIGDEVLRALIRIDQELDARLAGRYNARDLMSLRTYVMKSRSTMYARAAMIHPDLVDPVGPLGRPAGSTGGWGTDTDG